MIDLSKMVTEQANPNTQNLSFMSIQEAVKIMNQEDYNTVRCIESQYDMIAKVIALTSNVLENKGRIIYMGAGTSGRLGVLDAVECSPTFNVDANTVIGLIAGGETAFVKAVEGAEDSKELGEEELRKPTSMKQIRQSTALMDQAIELCPMDEQLIAFLNEEVVVINSAESRSFYGSKTIVVAALLIAAFFNYTMVGWNGFWSFLWSYVTDMYTLWGGAIVYILASRKPQFMIDNKIMAGNGKSHSFLFGFFNFSVSSVCNHYSQQFTTVRQFKTVIIFFSGRILRF